MSPGAIGVAALCAFVLIVVFLLAGDSKFGRAYGPAFTVLLLILAAIMAVGGGD